MCRILTYWHEVFSISLKSILQKMTIFVHKNIFMRRNSFSLFSTALFPRARNQCFTLHLGHHHAQMWDSHSTKTMIILRDAKKCSIQFKNVFMNISPIAKDWAQHLVNWNERLTRFRSMKPEFPYRWCFPSA